MQLDPFIITLGLPFDVLYSDKSSPEYQEFTTMVVQKVIFLNHNQGVPLTIGQSLKCT